MMKPHYVVERESGSDHCIVKYAGRQRFVMATGLEETEAEETAKAWNKEEAEERAKYVG